MISSYRLGDAVVLGLEPNQENELVAEHPGSIGAEFIAAKRQGAANIAQIVQQHMHKHPAPADVANATVVHVRLGDVVRGTHWHETVKRPFDVEYLRGIVPETDKTGKTYVIGKPFFARPSSTNYDECLTASTAYLADVLDALGAEHFDGGSADADLCCAVRAKNFVQGRGYFSQVIVDVRKALGLAVVETRCLDC